MRAKKQLPKPIFVMEDLTEVHHKVMMYVKNKMPDEVDMPGQRMETYSTRIKQDPATEYLEMTTTTGLTCHGHQLKKTRFHCRDS